MFWKVNVLKKYFSGNIVPDPLSLELCLREHPSYLYLSPTVKTGS